VPVGGDGTLKITVLSMRDCAVTDTMKRGGEMTIVYIIAGIHVVMAIIEAFIVLADKLPGRREKDK